MFLLDTNIIAELRKINLGKANSGVETWAKNQPNKFMFISVISLLELEIGSLRLERKDPKQGAVIRNWLDKIIKPKFKDRVLTITAETVLICSKMHIPNQKSLADSLIAATAIEHNLTVITRNEKDFADTGAKIFNPFS